MGTSPPNPTYEAGDECTHCHSVIFNDVTPKYVEIVVSDIDVCPLAIGPAPDGTFLLTQREIPCIWSLNLGRFTYSWRLTATNSVLTINEGLQIWFAAETFTACIDTFVNDTFCANPQDDGVNGTVTVHWGPTIGP